MSQDKVDAATDLLTEVMARAFFTKLAERGYVPADEADAQRLIELSHMIQTVKQAAVLRPGASELYKAAHEALASAMRPEHGQLEKDIAAGQIAAEILKDPEIQQKMAQAVNQGRQQ